MVASLKPAFLSVSTALHWSRFHTRVVLALGITWILDGLESRWRVRCPEH